MPAEVLMGRRTADLDTDFVVFLIGARVNRLRSLPRFVRIGRQMTAMQRELLAQPDLGCLHIENFFGRTTISVQYWRDFDALERFARSADHLHLPAWREFNRLVRDSGSVGIWHETYPVRAGEYESFYGNMPRFGLAAASDAVAVDRASTAARRLATGDHSHPDAPVAAY